MIRSGENVVNGVPVDVERRRVRRVSIRVKPGGRVLLVVPKWGATLRGAEAFLLSKWKWVLKTRAETLAVPPRAPVTDAEVAALGRLLGELHGDWVARLGECDVPWRIRRVKTVWGSCHIRARRITYSADLARAPRACVEYVVVHELTHLRAADHGPLFKRLMDERLPGWRERRRELNALTRAPASVPSAAPPPVAPRPVRLLQGELWDFSVS